MTAFVGLQHHPMTSFHPTRDSRITNNGNDLNSENKPLLKFFVQ
jgi:hypothetical protein